MNGPRALNLSIVIAHWLTFSSESDEEPGFSKFGSQSLGSSPIKRANSFYFLLQ